MMKRYTALILAALLALSLSACGGNSAADAGSEPSRTASADASADGADASSQEPADAETEPAEEDAADPSAEEDAAEEEPEGLAPLSVIRSMHQEYAWDDSWGPVSRMSYELFSLGEESAEKFPELARAVEEFNAIEEEALSSEFAEMEKGARQMLAEAPADYFRTQVIERGVFVRRADDAVLSVLLNTYYDYGGAHGGTQLTGVTFDAAGKVLELDDVVKDTDALPALIEEQLRAHYDPKYFYDPEEFPAWIEEHVEELPWTIETGGITFYFNEYVIAPYAAGYQVVSVPFAGNEDVFAEAFLETPAAWCREVTAHVPVYEDLDGDGAQETILVYREWDENQMGTGVHVTVGETDVFQPLEIWKMSPVLLHTKNGKNMLYVAAETGFGYHLMIFELSADGAALAETREAYWHDLWTPGDEGYYMSWPVLTDPGDFLLDTPVNTISYMSGYKHYEAGADGRPVSGTDEYTLNWPVELILLQDFTFEELDADGRSTGERSLPAGSEVSWIRSDGATDAVFSYAGEDGGDEEETLLRAKVVMTEEETLVGGHPVWELFDFPETLFGGEGNDWNPTIIQRQILLDTDTIGGVIFLGYIDPGAPMYWDDPDYYRNFITKAGYWDDFDFFSELMSDHFVATDWGNELYAIIPADPNANVEIYEWIIGEENGYTGERGQLLYHGENGSPVLLKCNVSDIMPSALVVITNPDGRTIEWNPFISLMDGHVQTVSNLEYMFDFTIYPEG